VAVVVRKIIRGLEEVELQIIMVKMLKLQTMAIPVLGGRVGMVVGMVTKIGPPDLVLDLVGMG
jgi:hypothetical protein